MTHEDCKRISDALWEQTMLTPEDIQDVVVALEKQIPKKPKIQVRGVYDEDNGDWMYDQEWNMCPACRKRNESEVEE